MYDVIIVGAGPAGLSAAIYSSRAGLKTLILEKGAPGGKVFLTHQIDNYPGFDSISGRELATTMHKHSTQYGAKYEYGEVLEILDVDGIKKIKTNVAEYETKAVIVATGTENKKLGTKGEEAYSGKGVSYCAVCDGNFFSGEDVVVIGGGNSALEESLYLAKICKTVTIIHRRDEFRSENITIDAVRACENIKFELFTEVEEFIGDDVLNSVRVRNNKTNEIKEIPTKGAFVYVGLKPISNILEKFDILCENKNVIADKNMRTKEKGIYTAGDLNDKELRQIVTAVSDGARAGQSVIEDSKFW